MDRMSFNPALLQIDIPARPDAMLKLAQLLAKEKVDLGALASLIESDMALAAAVMKAVNWPVYGLKGRVKTVQQAATYLGTREISAMAYDFGLRSVFPQAATLDVIWAHASIRGLLMGRLAEALCMDAWSAHTAGLFEECGKAILFKHDPQAYTQIMAAARNDVELAVLELKSFGISHDKLGAKLCKSWGLSPAALASVENHVQVISDLELPHTPGRSICVLSGLAHALMNDPEQLEEICMALAPQAMMDQTLLLRGARKVKDKLDEYLADA
jgi:HD-like signal output (HDOD) protein